MGNVFHTIAVIYFHLDKDKPYKSSSSPNTSNAFHSKSIHPRFPMLTQTLFQTHLSLPAGTSSSKVIIHSPHRRKPI